MKPRVMPRSDLSNLREKPVVARYVALCFEGMVYVQQLNHIGNYIVLYIKYLNSINYYFMSSLVLSYLASNSQIVANLYFTEDQNWQRGPGLAAKIGPARRILAAKVVCGPNFGTIFCQNRSSQTDFRGTNFGVTGLKMHAHAASSWPRDSLPLVLIVN